MQTTLICKNCSTENPFFLLTCRSCSAYLRDKVSNIDLWDVLIKLIESPSAAYARIIHAEHKNFIFLILFLASVKLSINTIFISLALHKENQVSQNFILLLLIIIGLTSLSLIICSLLYQKFLKNKTRFRDNFAILSYSLFPHVFALIILFPIELIIFGYTVFSVNPSPFIIKEFVAYTMLGFEGLFIIWAMFLSFMAFRRQSDSLNIVFVFTLLFNILIYGSILITAKYFFI
jgi:hypothetical protein